MASTKVLTEVLRDNPDYLAYCRPALTYLLDVRKLPREVLHCLPVGVFGKPEHIFVVRIQDFIWSMLMHEATIKPTGIIKMGLLQYLRDYTWALAMPKELNHDIKIDITAPTRIKYLDLLKSENGIDYTKGTYDFLFKLITDAAFKNTMTMCQFWWSFCRQYLPEIIDMLADKGDPNEVQSESFWIMNAGGQKTIMANLNISLFLSIYCGRLKILGVSLFKKDSSFPFGDWLEKVLNWIENSLVSSHEESKKFVERYS